jgi:phosphatidylserine/phosphatidylglycerophosphate/cardiolipin synthase-like enzyme
VTTVTGRLVDENGNALPNLSVEARGDWLLTTEQLSHAISDPQGRFTLEVPEILEVSELPRSFRFRVIDVTKRPLIKDRELSGDVPSHDLGDITIQSADLNGLLVTDLTGVASYVSDGNALKLLIDGEEAFGRVADEIKLAEHSINMTQLFFSVPDKFDKDNEAIDPQTKEPKEKAKLVFKFSAAQPNPIDPLVTPNSPKQPWIGNERLERLILDRALTHNDMNVRILLNEPALGRPEGLLWLILLSLATVPVAGALGAQGIGVILALLGISLPFFPAAIVLTVILGILEAWKIKGILRNQTDVDEVKAYYAAAITDAAPAQPRITVRGFRQPVPDNGVLHCKMVIVDNKRAVVIGSPFTQRYFDDPAHKIAEPRRGSNTADIVHDVSAAVVGPAVRDLHEALRLFWNEDLPLNSSERIMGINAPPKESGGEDGVTTVQVVRTLSANRFQDLSLAKHSEKGILEAYLRAFASAKMYIYLETQYFTDSVITDALIEVLKQRHDLELILMINIKPDVLFYPRRQACQIKKLRDAGGARVGAFTRWSYEGTIPNNPRPWIAPVYLHSKVGIVDDSWATIGSANLDGLSLDYNLLLSPLVFGETTASEVNLSIIPPAVGEGSPIAKLLRRRLFVEHLGLDPNNPLLDARPPEGWLSSLWIPRAKDALQHIKEGRPTSLPGFVLEYPPDAGSLTSPRKHLAALGVKVEKVTESVVRPIRTTRAFDFASGMWSKTPELEDIEL